MKVRESLDEPVIGMHVVGNDFDESGTGMNSMNRPAGMGNEKLRFQAARSTKDARARRPTQRGSSWLLLWAHWASILALWPPTMGALHPFAVMRLLS